MKSILIYHLEVACCLVVFYLFLILILNKEANFHIKRLFILIAGFLAFVLPALNVQYSFTTEQTPILVNYYNYIPDQLIMFSPLQESINEFNVWSLLSCAWGIGIGIMLIRLLISFYQVKKIMKDAKTDQDDASYKITNLQIQSFSFFKAVVLNKQHNQSEAIKYILAHEQAHSKQLHSFDVLFVEIIKIFQWFNPIAWLFAKDALQNLEYLADREVLASCPNIKEYQMAIIQHSHQTGPEILRTEFSKTNLKNRIIMMNQPNNRKKRPWQLLLLLPIVGALFFSFSVKLENLDLKKEVTAMLPKFTLPESNIKKPTSFQDIKILDNKKIDTPSQITETDTLNKEIKEVFTIVENQPYPSTGDMDSYYEKLNADIKYPPSAKAQNIKGKVFVQFIVQKDGTLREVQAVKGIGAGCDEEAVRVIKNGPTWIAGTQRGHAVDVRMIMPIPFGVPLKTRQNNSTRIIKGEVKSEDGTPMPGANVIIKGTHVGTVTDRDGNYSIKLNSDNNELIFSYMGYNTNVVMVKEKEEVDVILVAIPDFIAPIKPEQKGISLRIAGQELLDESEQPLFILNDKQIEPADFKNINADEIESISVLKDASAIVQYGENAKNGVVIIKTKENISVNKTLNFDTENPPIFYKDGVEISKEEMEKIDPNDIESVNVVKGDSATEVYGDKGKNGVIIIKMK